MKFTQLAEKNFGSNKDISLESAINFSVLQDDLTYAFEAMEVSTADLSTLKKMDTYFSHTTGSVSLEAACIGLNNIRRRYGLANVAVEGFFEGVKNAISRVLKFLGDTMRAIGGKFKSMISGTAENKEKTEESINSLIEKIKAARSDTSSMEALDKEYKDNKADLDEFYKTFKQKGVIPFKIKGKYTPVPLSNVGVSSLISAIPKMANAIASTVDAIASITEKFLKEIEGIISADTIDEEKIKTAADGFMSDYIGIISKSGMKSSQDNAILIYTSALPVSENIVIQVTEGADINEHKLEVSRTSNEKDKEADLSLDPAQFEHIFKEVSSSGLEEKFKEINKNLSDIASKTDSLNKTASAIEGDKAASLKKLTSFIGSVVSRAPQAPLQMAAIVRASEMALIGACQGYCKLHLKYLTSVVTTGVAKEDAESADRAADLDDNVPQWEISEVVGLASEAFDDLDAITSTMNSGARYISKDGETMSLEAYANILADKYRSFHISLEGRDDEEYEYTEEDKEEREYRKRQKQYSKEGVIGFFKSVFAFVVRVIKTIFSKIMNLFRGDKSKQGIQKQKVKKLTERTKAIQKEGLNTPVAAAVKSNKVEVPPEVEEYWKTGKYSIDVTSSAFSVGKDATIKEIFKLCQDFENSVVELPTFIDAISVIPDIMEDVIKQSAERKTDLTLLDYDDVRKQIFRQVDERIDEIGARQAQIKGTKTISSFGETYLVASDRIGNATTEVIFKIETVRSEEFSSTMHIDLKTGELMTVLENMPTLLSNADRLMSEIELGIRNIEARQEKQSSNIYDLLKIRLDHMTDDEIRASDNRAADKVLLEFIRFVANYMRNMVIAIGKISAAMVSQKAFLLSLLTAALEKEEKLRQINPASN